MVWGQAGGSIQADSAGVWWDSMPFENRIRNLVFIENQEIIESNWHQDFGDRKNEIVFIGKDMDEKKIKSDLFNCLSTDSELSALDMDAGYNDSWPLDRAYALDQ